MKFILLVFLSLMLAQNIFAKKYYARKMETYSYLGNYLDKTTSVDTVVRLKVKHKKVFIDGVKYRRTPTSQTSYHTRTGDICKVTHTANPKRTTVILEGRTTQIKHFIVEKKKR